MRLFFKDNTTFTVHRLLECSDNYPLPNEGEQVKFYNKDRVELVGTVASRLFAYSDSMGVTVNLFIKNVKPT